MPTLQQFIREHTCKHWTAKGRFKIEPVIIADSLLFELRFGDTKLGTYLHPQTAAKELYEGKHDDALGFSPREANVPSNPEDWNGLE